MKITKIQDKRADESSMEILLCEISKSLGKMINGRKL